MLFPPSYYGDEFSPRQEAGQAAQESLRDQLLGVCIEDEEDAPCRRCIHCRAVVAEHEREEDA